MRTDPRDAEGKRSKEEEEKKKEEDEEKEKEEVKKNVFVVSQKGETGSL